MRSLPISCSWLVLVCLIACGQDGTSDASTKPPGDAGDRDTGPRRCSGDRECSDGMFCNGIERCEPNARSADEHGCVAARTARCLPSQRCDESEVACLSDCDEHADADQDGHDAENCDGLDCDDADPERFPGNAEVCDPDGHDEDCDQSTLAGDDGDEDNDDHVSERCCNADECGDDCDDASEAAHYTYPGTGELCDEADNDCDGEVDETPAEVPWYRDRDGDHYGVEGDDEVISCAPVAGHALLATDCDDRRAAANPGTAEACDGVDNDCDEAVDEELSCGGCDPACDPHARCVEADGEPRCVCDDGYEGDGRSCQDLDECTEDTDGCDGEPDACVNTSGGFECECPEGYVGNGRGANGCTDFNECVNDTDSCDNTPDACMNLLGSYVCVCPSGYEGEGVGGAGCSDIDECELDSNECDSEPNACANTVGSFHCVCPAGYEGDGVDSSGCEDIDECELVNHGGCDSDPDACVNASGSHDCECPPGYEGDGVGASGCEDIDECDTNNGGCDSLVTCTEGAPGTRSCGACPIEYGGDGESGCLPALTALSIAGSTLMPELDPDVTSYAAYVPFSDATATLSASVPMGMNLWINSSVVASGTETEIALDAEETVVTIFVLSGDRPAREYTLTLLPGLPPTEDYGDPGPFTAMVVSDTGPGGDYTLFRPEVLGERGFVHPLATWGGGNATTPASYAELLLHVASHGVVVIASQGVAGDPALMTTGLDWLIEQNDQPGELMGKLDVATALSFGHSLGGFAAVEAGAHAAVVATVSMHGAMGAAENLHGPLLLLTGSQDLIVSREAEVEPTYERSNVTTLLAELSGATHFTPISDADERAAVTAWLRLWLYGDDGARRYFEGPEALLCNEPWLSTCLVKNWPSSLLDEGALPRLPAQLP